MSDRTLSDADPVRLALESSYRSGNWAKYEGEACDSLIQRLKREHHRSFVQLCCSGTLATELALRGLGIGPGDEVALAAYDFPGNFRAIEAVGAMPVLFDLEEHGWGADRDSILSIPCDDGSSSTKIKAVILSHLHGSIVDIPSLTNWAKDNKIALIEDACQAHGAQWNRQPIGSFGDVSILSFGGSKLISSGRGGAVLTNDPYIDQRMRVYRDRGNDAFAMSELQACVIEPQWDQLPSKNFQRWNAVQYLEAEFWRAVGSVSNADRSIRFANRSSHELPAFYKWGLQIHSDREPVAALRNQLLSRLDQAMIPAGEGFRGFHQRSDRRCRKLGPLPRAAIASDGTILIHHTFLLESRQRLDQLIQILTKQIV